MEAGVYADASSYFVGEDIGVGDNSINIVMENSWLRRRGDKLISEDAKIEFEDDTNKGSIPEDNYGNKNLSQFTRESRIITEPDANRMALQDDYNDQVFIGQESGTGTGNIVFDGTSAVLDVEGNILLNGTDSGKSDADDKLILDRTASAGTDAGDNVLLDSSGGRDLNDRIRLSSTNYELISGNEGGFFLLNGTDGSSTNAGDEVLLEIATHEHIQQQSINSANGVDAESGGLSLPVSEVSIAADDTIRTFDSTRGTFDTITTTWDSAS